MGAGGQHGERRLCPQSVVDLGEAGFAVSDVGFRAAVVWGIPPGDLLPDYSVMEGAHTVPLVTLENVVTVAQVPQTWERSLWAATSPHPRASVCSARSGRTGVCPSQQLVLERKLRGHW